MADIVEEVKALARWFPIKAGIFDQAGGWGSQELMTGAGFRQIEMKHFIECILARSEPVAGMMHGQAALEIIEARWLFDVPAEKISVMIQLFSF